MKNMNTLAKGLTAGIAAGTVIYIISQSTPYQKREMKRNTEKTIHSFSNMVNSFASMIK